MLSRKKIVVLGAAAAALIAAAVSLPLMLAHPAATSSNGAPPSVTSSVVPAPPKASHQPYVALSAAAISALPEAKYNAVIPGLIAYATDKVAKASAFAYTVSADIPIYGSDQTTPVARFAATNFMLLKSVIVPVQTDGDWTLVLTPARQQLPSTDGGHAPAQTVGWVRTASLVKDHPLPQYIEVSVSKQTLTIVNTNGSTASTYPAGVGTPGTPTPTGVIGYIQARYVDPTQGEASHPIQLTSLHATAADNPYLGKDGGLIGLHYNVDSKGAVSHGCVRLAVPAINAVTALPVGTVIEFLP
jgi:lipoprotein-anchoring transpeptidase ErfK/SrfK